MGSCEVEICWQLGIGGITVGRLVDRNKRGLGANRLTKYKEDAARRGRVKDLLRVLQAVIITTHI